jgi:hypothetical protein
MLVNKNVKLSVKGQQNNESLLDNRKSLGNKTKRGTTPSPSELIDIEIFDQWVDNLDSATQESFIEFARTTYSVIEIYLYARFLDYKGTVIGCEGWVLERYPKPDHRKMLLQEIDEMREDMRKLREDIENLAVKRDVGVARLAGMAKELRGTISQVENYTGARDRRGLLLAGADQAIRELLAIFKEDPIEGPLSEASMSVWAKMQLSE